MKLRVNADQLAKLDSAQRREVEGQLRELEGARRANPLIFYNHPLFSKPHPKQLEFHASADPLKAFLGGNRAGKTTAGINDDLIQALPREAVPEHLRAFKRFDPPFYCRIVIPDLGQTLEGVTLQKIKEWCPPDELVGGGFKDAWDARLRLLSFKCGSWFQFLSNDQDLDKFGGAALHRVHYDEEPREDIRKECLMRLIDYGGDEVFTMTPLLGMSWMYADIYEPWTEGRLPECTVVTVDMDDNPHLDQRTKVRALEGLSNEERQARKSGRFVHFAGLIYPEFSRDRHVVPELAELPPVRRDITGIDPGIRFQMAGVFAFLDAEDVLWIYDELVLQGNNVAQFCDEFHVRRARWGCEPGAWNVIDPSARNRSIETGRELRAAFQQAGVPTILGQNSRPAGFNAVKERLETDRLKVTANCQTLISQFAKYRWKSPPRTAEGAVAEEPVRKDDHCLDAMRYMVMSPLVSPKRPNVAGSTTFQDRLLRANLERLSRPRVDHPSGPGVFA